MVSSVSCMIQSIPEVSHVSHRISRLASPIYDNEVPKRSQTPNMKMYAYHEDFGHLTEDYFSIKKEISYPLRKLHLKELLGRMRDKIMRLFPKPRDMLIVPRWKKKKHKEIMLS